MHYHGQSEMETLFQALLRQVIKEEISPLFDLLRQTQTAEKDDELLSVKEALKLFTPSISRGTLHRYTKQHKIQVHRVGKRVFYSKRELLNSVKSIKRLTYLK